MNTKESFSTRLAQLRTDEEISAREMSLDLGQNPSYINRIENQKAYPSMQVFFYICDYLKITPGDFFNQHMSYPTAATKLWQPKIIPPFHKKEAAHSDRPDFGPVWPEAA